MKKSGIKVLALFLSMALCLSLGGCGKEKTTSEKDGSNVGLIDFDDQTGSGFSGTDNSSGSGQTSNATISGSGETIKKRVEFDSKNPFSNIPKRLKGTTVKFAVWGDEGNDKYKPLLTAFTRETGIKVQFVFIDQSNYASQVMQNIVVGSAPDLIVSCENFATLIEVTQPIEKLVNLDDDFWDKKVTQEATINGHTYFVNSLKSIWENHEYVIFNKSLFSKNNLRSPRDYWESGKWSYENALKCMEEISKVDGLYGGLIAPNVLSASFGGPIVSYDPATKTFKNNITSAQTVKACQWFVNLYEKNIFGNGMATSGFVNGNIGLTYGGVYSSKFNGWYSAMDGSLLDAVPLPTSIDGKATSQVGTFRGYGIPKGAGNPEGAAYFLRYFLDYDYYKAAKIDAFKSKTLENFYFKEFVPLIKKEGITFTHYQDAMLVANESTDTFITLTDTTQAQVPTLLASKSNRVDDAVGKMNAKIKSYK